MVLQCKNTSLLELLESHAGGSTLKEAIQPRRPNPLPTRTSHVEPLEKKWKIEKKGKEMSEEVKVHLSKDLKPQKREKLLKDHREGIRLRPRA